MDFIYFASYREGVPVTLQSIVRAVVACGHWANLSDDRAEREQHRRGPQRLRLAWLLVVGNIFFLVMPCG